MGDQTAREVTLDAVAAEGLGVAAGPANESSSDASQDSSDDESSEALSSGATGYGALPSSVPGSGVTPAQDTESQEGEGYALINALGKTVQSLFTLGVRDDLVLLEVPDRLKQSHDAAIGPYRALTEAGVGFGTGKLATAPGRVGKMFFAVDAAQNLSMTGQGIYSGNPLQAGLGTLGLSGNVAGLGVRGVPVEPKGAREVFTAQEDIGKIWSSGRVWGQTEGSVYGMTTPNASRLRTMIDTPTVDPGTIVFRGNAAQLFKAHEVVGPFSGMKRLLGQQKAGFGDVIFDDAYKVGNRIYVYEAHIGSHLGQSTNFAMSRLWTRRIAIDGTLDAGIGIGVGAAGVYIWNQE